MPEGISTGGKWRASSGVSIDVIAIQKSGAAIIRATGARNRCRGLERAQAHEV